MLLMLEVLVDVVVGEEVVVRVGRVGEGVGGGRSFALKIGVEEGSVEVGIVFGEGRGTSEGVVISEI